MKNIKSFDEIIDKYDAFILDLWGVIHDGIALYPHAKETLETIKKANKKVIFLSNAPRRRKIVIDRLNDFGVPRNIYIDAVSSGDVTRDYLENNSEYGNKYVYVGLEKDRKLLEGLGYEEVSDFKNAGFILNTGFDHFFQPLEEKIPFLKESLSHKLPMVCANPDIIVVRQTGEEILCAGVLAEEYIKMGGQVKYLGKPYKEDKEAYSKCFGILAEHNIKPEQCLAVGDNLDTDIAGANKVGIDCLFISGGILTSMTKNLDEEIIKSAILKAGVKPTYICEHFY